jgi:hypothetical protein
LGALAAPRDAGEPRSNLYIVQMLEDPAVAYRGNIPGYSATKPAKGTKINPADPAVAQYTAYLDSRHDQAVASVGGRKLLDYRFTYNGFAAELSAAQAESLKTAPGVLAVSKDELIYADTSSTPHFLGLDGSSGLWAQLGGVGCAGGEIIIGIIDSGIWPESASFGNMPSEGNCNRDYQSNKSWRGVCDVGVTCNNKLIGARHFNAAWGGDQGIAADRPWEYLSARDYNGHGTHTSATAGGNNAVATTGPATVFGRVSGMAPRARIAMYKALWSTRDASTASGLTSDLVAAIDQAVADGVDVINYSISGTTTNFLDPVQVAYLFAADAGVFVAVSAGNNGPTTSTVAHPGPWLTTVAAGTHNRDGRGSVVLGIKTYNGASVAAAAVTAPVINSTAAGLAGAAATAVRLCFAAGDNGGTPVLDPAKVAGKIVVCDRGVNARVNKSLAVRDAGGAGMILLNTGPNSLNADFHFVPSVHLADTDGAAVKAFAATAGATATINQGTLIYDAPAPFTAVFSSRGPLRAGGGDLLKPDVIAPGQDVLAAVAPPGQSGLSFNLLSGTSMSSPHVAGLAALLKERHSTWSPMMIKSALMTSAGDILDGPNTNPLVIFRQGAGHVRPNNAADPGLVYDSGFNDWLAFLCGTTNGVSASTCSALAGAGYSLDASDMNVASVAIGDMAGIQTVTRRVTNVGSRRAIYTASVSGMTGFTVNVTPASLTLGAGQTASYAVKFTRTSATLNSYAGGQLTWSDGTHAVRTPLVVRPVALAAPAQVSGSYGVTFGYDGSFTATGRGLVAANTSIGSVMQDPSGTFAPVDKPWTAKFIVNVPSGSTYARFSLFNANSTPGSDLDLYVYNSSGAQVGASGGGTADEEVNLLNPSGTYTVWVHGFGTPAGGSSFTLFSWVLGSSGSGNMTVSGPAEATTGGHGTINLAFSGLTAGTRYLGSVAYTGVAGLPNPTIVRVDTP